MPVERIVPNGHRRKVVWEIRCNLLDGAGRTLCVIVESSAVSELGQYLVILGLEEGFHRCEAILSLLITLSHLGHHRLTVAYFLDDFERLKDIRHLQASEERTA